LTIELARIGCLPDPPARTRRRVAPGRARRTKQQTRVPRVLGGGLSPRRGGSGARRRIAGRSAGMGARWMPWRPRPTKDAATRRNARGRRWRPAIPRSPNGATRPGSYPGTRATGGARGELKHLSTRRKRKDSPSSGERTGRSPNRGGESSRSALPSRGKNGGPGGGDRPLASWDLRVSRTPLERAAGAGESPVGDGAGAGVGFAREYRRTRGIRREAGWTTTQG
jgi:hypothetical protein